MTVQSASAQDGGVEFVVARSFQSPSVTLFSLIRSLMNSSLNQFLELPDHQFVVE